MTKLIPLSRGLYSLVDDEDFEALAAQRWCAAAHRSTHYAIRHAPEKRGTPSQTIRMHRAILGLAGYDGRQVDHVNGDGLDNRRANLRIAANWQNVANQRVRRDSLSGFKGVRLYPRGGWGVRINDHGRRIWIGSYPSAHEAAHAYDEAARRLYGEFARPNFPAGECAECGERLLAMATFSVWEGSAA